jgi:hypothetical protein
MMSAASRNLPEPPAREYIGRVFSQHREELEWLANFLTGDETIAAACLVDACALAESENRVFRNGSRSAPVWLRSAPQCKSSNDGWLNYHSHTNNAPAFMEDIGLCPPIGVRFWWRNQVLRSRDSMSCVVLRW